MPWGRADHHGDVKRPLPLHTSGAHAVVRHRAQEGVLGGPNLSELLGGPGIERQPLRRLGALERQRVPLGQMLVLLRVCAGPLGVRWDNEAITEELADGMAISVLRDLVLREWARRASLAPRLRHPVARRKVDSAALRRAHAGSQVSAHGAPRRAHPAARSCRRCARFGVRLVAAGGSLGGCGVPEGRATLRRVPVAARIRRPSPAAASRRERRAHHVRAA